MLLAATVIGSGIMAERLAGGNLAVALLANTAATVAVLATLIALFGPISGAHFNPAVSLVEALRGKLTLRQTVAYVIVQIAGCCLGALLAHAMFEIAAAPGIHASADGSRAMALRSRCHRRVDPGCRGVCRTERGGLAGVRLDRSGLLVYGINLVRQSRDYDRAVSQQHLCRHRPSACRRVHCVATVRGGYWPPPGKVPAIDEPVAASNLGTQ